MMKRNRSRRRFKVVPLFPSTPVPDGEWRDDSRVSRPLKRGARVYIRPRATDYSGGAEVSGWGGTIVQLRVDHAGQRVVDVRENGTRALRSTRPERCRVQYGQSKASKEAAAAAEVGT